MGSEKGCDAWKAVVREDEKLMKRPDQSRKETNLKKSHTRELEKLKYLKLHGRMANQWLKEKFREKYESSGDSRRDG
jgi:hypothetical protein